MEEENGCLKPYREMTVLIPRMEIIDRYKGYAGTEPTGLCARYEGDQSSLFDQNHSNFSIENVKFQEITQFQEIHDVWSSHIGEKEII